MKIPIDGMRKNKKAWIILSIGLLTAGIIYLPVYKSLEAKISVQKQLIDKMKAETAGYKKIVREIDIMRRTLRVFDQKTAIIKHAKQARESTARQFAGIVNLIPDKDIQLTRINLAADTAVIEGYTSDVRLFKRYAADLDRSQWFSGYRFGAPEIAMRDQASTLEFKIKLQKPKAEPKTLKKYKKRIKR